MGIVGIDVVLPSCFVTTKIESLRVDILVRTIFHHPTSLHRVFTLNTPAVQTSRCCPGETDAVGETQDQEI